VQTRRSRPVGILLRMLTGYFERIRI
jgi:hypothetical protein